MRFKDIPEFIKANYGWEAHRMLSAYADKVAEERVTELKKSGETSINGAIIYAGAYEEALYKYYRLYVVNYGDILDKSGKKILSKSIPNKRK